MSYLDEFAEKLNLPKREKEQVLREVSSHYYEIRDELVAEGMCPDEADRAAGCRLGSPDKIATDLMSVHCPTSSWWSALIAALLVPIAAVLVASQEKLVEVGGWPGIAHRIENMAHWVQGIACWVTDSPSIKSGHVVAAAIVLLAGILGTLAIYAIRHDQRPIWLAPCIISSLLLITRLPYALVRVCPQYARPWEQDLLPHELARNTALEIVAARVAVAILAAVVIAAYWRSPRLKSIVLGALAAQGLGAVAQWHGYQSSSWGLWFVGLAGCILLATRLFAYGNLSKGAYVSLFVFAYFVIGHWGIGYGQTANGTIPLFQPHLLIAVGTILAFARASAWHTKTLIPLAGVLMSIPVGIMLGWPRESYWDSDPLIIARGFQLLVMLVVAIVYAIRARTEMPQIAQ